MNKEIKNKNYNSKGCYKVVGGAFGLVIIAIMVVSMTYIGLRAMGAYLIVSSDLQAANAIIILSGGDETRMKEALRIYNENYARQIILTETGNEVEGYSYLHSFDMRILLLVNGVPSGNILITEKVVSSTRDEALAVKNLKLTRQINTGKIVTDPYHTRRALKIFQKEFADTNIQLFIRAAPNSWYNSRTWFLSIRGWQSTLQEYLKLIMDRFGWVVD